MGKHEEIDISNFIISKPDLQAGLTAEIPRGEIPIQYINRYEAEHEVRCAFCDKHTPHKKGFTAQMEDGRIALCGKDCGIKYFGKEVADNFEEELEKQIRKATKRKIIKRTLDGAPVVLARLKDEWIELEENAVAACRALHMDFRYSGILNQINERGHFELKDVKRRWIEREDEFGQTKRVPVDEEIVLLKVSAASVLRTGEGAASRLKRAKRELQRLLAVDTSKELSDTVVERMTACRSSILADLTNGVRYLDLCNQFFTKDNIKAMSKLTRHVKTNLGKIALHKRPHGFDLILTPEDYVEDDEIYNFGRERETFHIASFENRPTINDLVAPLKSGE